MRRFIYTIHPIDTLLNPCRLAMGLELEYATAAQQPKLPAGFTMVRDGSVSSGCEIVSAIPQAGVAWLKHCASLVQMISRYNLACDRTCGLHIHVDATSAKLNDILSLMLLYSRLEREIYSVFISPARASDEYCDRYYRRCGFNYAGFASTCTSKAELIQQLYSLAKLPPRMRRGVQATAPVLPHTEVLAIKASKYGRTGRSAAAANCRYFGLNLHSWLYRGSVEWRMKEGTVNPEELLMWPLLCGVLTELGFKYPRSQWAKLEGFEDLLAMHDERGQQVFPVALRPWVEEKLAANCSIDGKSRNNTRKQPRPIAPNTTEMHTATISTPEGLFAEELDTR